MTTPGLEIDGTFLGHTRLSVVDGPGGRLTFCGYELHDLASHASWEEVAYLLLYGDLPNATQLATLRQQMAEARTLSPAELALLRVLPTGGHGMDAVRTALSALAQLHPPDLIAADTLLAAGVSLAARLPTLVAALIRLRQGQEPVPPDPTLHHAANFLWMLHGTPPDAAAVRALDTYMVVLAENGLNIATFVAAVVTSTRNDVYSALTSAISTLKGQAHGGANEHAMRTFLQIGSPDNAARALDEMITNKQRLMGVGHRIFEVEDPRVRHLRQQSEALAARPNADPALTLGHAIAARVADIVQEHPFFVGRGLYPNVEFYSAPLLYQLGFPLDYFTVVFACARTPGWIAHMHEQLAQRRIVRPEALYIGPDDRPFLPLEQRP